MSELIASGDNDVIPLYVGIVVFAFTNIWHTRVASSFVGTYKDKVYFYLTHLISMTPMIVYLFKVIEIVFGQVTRSVQFFSIFYMEWIFATVLMLISLGRLGKMSLKKYMRLSYIDAFMIFGGYISMMGQTPLVIYIPYGVSAGCFVYIIYEIMQSYRNYQHTSLIANSTGTKPPVKIWFKVYKFLAVLTICSWSLYPLNHILFKTGKTSFITCLSVNIGLDIFTKIIFVNTLIGSHLVYRGDTSVLAFMTRRMLKIHSLDVIITEEVDTKLTHRVSVQLDMHTPGPDDKPVTHLTHVSEVGRDKIQVLK